MRGRLAGDSVADVGPASVMVGNIVQGNRLASAQGRDMGILDEDSDSAKKVGWIFSLKNKHHYPYYIIFLSVLVSIHFRDTKMESCRHLGPCDFHVLEFQRSGSSLSFLLSVAQESRTYWKSFVGSW